jgi:L-fucose isomerase-like protein
MSVCLNLISIRATPSDEAVNPIIGRYMPALEQMGGERGSGLGVGIQGTLPEGAVTLLRIGGTAMDKIWLAEGEVLQAGDVEDLCRTQAEVRLTHGKVQDLLYAPLGNHLILVKGHHADRLWAWWKTTIAQWAGG